jgi:hypothetical protein
MIFGRWGMLGCLVLSTLAASLLAQQPPAPSGESSSRPHGKPAKGASVPPFDPGSIRDGVYANSYFGFNYKLPFGWVDRTNAMQDDQPDAAKDSAQSLVLLATFAQPPEAPRNAINSGVVIAAEKVSSYPGLKAAADYFGPITQLTTDKGFKVVNEPFEFAVGTKTLVRGDFSKEMGKLTIHQTCLVLLEKTYVVSFTLIEASEDEVNGLIENLSFGARKTTR